VSIRNRDAVQECCDTAVKPQPYCCEPLHCLRCSGMTLPLLWIGNIITCRPHFPEKQRASAAARTVEFLVQMRLRHESANIYQPATSSLLALGHVGRNVPCRFFSSYALVSCRNPRSKPIMNLAFCQGAKWRVVSPDPSNRPSSATVGQTHHPDARFVE